MPPALPSPPHPSSLDLVVGLPGAGRTTWLARRILRPNSWTTGGRGSPRLTAAALHWAGAGPSTPGDPSAPLLQLLGARGRGSLFDHLANGHDPVLGIDDLHLLAPADQDALGEHLISFVRAGIGVVVTSRTTPPWPLARWIVDGLARLTAPQELRLRAGDLAAAVGAHRRAPPAWVEQLVARTDGWATTACGARQLVSEVGPQPTDADLDMLVTRLGNLLSEAVLADLTEDEVSLVVAAAVLDGLSAPMADHLFGRGASDRLATLGTTRPALFRDPDANGFLIEPPLLAEGLARWSERHRRSEVLAWLRKAADWHQQMGQLASGVELLVAHQQWDDALAALISGPLDMTEPTNPRRFFKAMESMPRAAWEGDAIASLHHALLAYAVGRHREASQTLAHSTLANHPLDPVLATVAAAIGTMAIAYDAPADSTLAAAKRTLAALEDIDEDRLPVIAGIRSRRPYVALAQIGAGRAETLLYGWERARVHLAPVADDPTQVTMIRRHAQAALAWVHALRGDLRAATAYARAADEATAALGRSGSSDLAEAHLAHAQVALWRGLPEEVNEALALAEAAGRRHEASAQLAAVAVVRAQAQLRAGEPEAAFDTLEAVPVHAQPDATSTRASALRARALARAGHLSSARLEVLPLSMGPDTVLAIAELLPERADEVLAWQPPPWPGPRIVARLAQGVAATHTGKKLSADGANEAEALAHASGAYGPFQDVPAALRLVLSPLAGAGAGVGARGSTRAPAEPLTPREIQVLKALAQDQPLTGVAAGLYLSINTVKTHNRNIYRKLGASSRAEAVARANRLGLI